MKHEEAQDLLGRVGVLRHPCDLDLLLFFARHPRALISSEQLTVWLGYDLKQIAESLEVLLHAGVLTRTQNPANAARMYVLNVAGPGGGWLPSLLAFASTREGRLAMVAALSRPPATPSDSSVSHHADGATAASRPRPVMVRRNRDQDPDTMAG